MERFLDAVICRGLHTFVEKSSSARQAERSAVWRRRMGGLKFECEVPRPVGCIFPQRVCVLEIAIFHNCFSTVFVQRCVFVGSTGVSTFVPLHSTPHRTLGILLLVRLAKLTSMTCSIIGFDTNRDRECVRLSSRVWKHYIHESCTVYAKELSQAAR